MTKQVNHLLLPIRAIRDAASEVKSYLAKAY